MALYLKNSILSSKVGNLWGLEGKPGPSTTLASSMAVISNCDSPCFYRDFGAEVRKKEQSKVVMSEDKETGRSRADPAGAWQGRERPKIPKLSLTLVPRRCRMVLSS